MDVTPRTVQRRIAGMVRDGIIRREERRIPGKGSKTNLYHLDPLIEAALPYAQEKLKERALQAKANKDRSSRTGRPHLTVVPSKD